MRWVLLTLLSLGAVGCGSKAQVGPDAGSATTATINFTVKEVK